MSVILPQLYPVSGACEGPPGRPHHVHFTDNTVTLTLRCLLQHIQVFFMQGSVAVFECPHTRSSCWTARTEKKRLNTVGYMRCTYTTVRGVYKCCSQAAGLWKLFRKSLLPKSVTTILLLFSQKHLIIRLLFRLKGSKSKIKGEAWYCYNCTCYFCNSNSREWNFPHCTLTRECSRYSMWEKWPELFLSVILCTYLCFPGHIVHLQKELPVILVNLDISKIRRIWNLCFAAFWWLIKNENNKIICCTAFLCKILLISLLISGTDTEYDTPLVWTSVNLWHKLIFSLLRPAS